jgi:hypothetical protein
MLNRSTLKRDDIARWRGVIAHALGSIIFVAAALGCGTNPVDHESSNSRPVTAVTSAAATGIRPVSPDRVQGMLKASSVALPTSACSQSARMSDVCPTAHPNGVFCSNDVRPANCVLRGATSDKSAWCCAD